MKQNRRSTMSCMNCLLAILLTGCLTFMSGTAYARYQETISGNYTLTVRKPATFQIIQQEEWKQNGEVQSYTFSVGNSMHSSDTYFNIRFTATRGLDGADIKLVTENTRGIKRKYSAFVKELDDESDSYETIGAGQEYIFYDDGGKELVFELEGKKESVKDFTLEITNGNQPGLVEIVVSEPSYDNVIYEREVSNADGKYTWALTRTSIESTKPSELEIDATAKSKEETMEIIQHPSENIPCVLKINWPEGCEKAVLTLNDEKFPEFYGYYVEDTTRLELTEAGYIEIEDDIVFFEFPEFVLQTGKSVLLKGYFYSEEENMTSDEETESEQSYMEVVSKCLYRDEVTVNKAENESVDVTLQDVANPVMERGETLVWSLQSEFLLKEEGIKLEYLTEAGYKKGMETKALTAKIEKISGMYQVKVKASSGQTPKPGTYCINITQYSEINGNTFPIQSIELPFFVINE